MNREQCEKLIEKLADKTLSAGCVVYDKDEFPHVILMKNGAGNFLCEVMNNVQHTIKPSQVKKVVGHPIRIGDVLEKLEGVTNSFAKVNYEHDVEKLCKYWMPCGFTKSLQETIEESGWETKGLTEPCLGCHNDTTCSENCYGEWLKDPNARALFEFLSTLFPQE